MAKNSGSKRAGDAREWDEECYKNNILVDRELRCRTVFRTTFAPSNPITPETLVCASSDGSIAAYSLSSCIDSSHPTLHSRKKGENEFALGYPFAEPFCTIQGHKGPAYDLKFYGSGDESLLLSCGDDGHIRGWKWVDLLNSDLPLSRQGSHLKPILDFANPQQEGPWGALSPIPENNAIAINEQEGSVFSAGGDSCAYCWDMESGKIKTVFKGHLDYLHCIAAHESTNQIITGSEDGTARIWDCRSGACTQVISPEKSYKLQQSSWVSSLAIDSSGSWLVCGTSRGMSAWSLLSYECIFSINCRVPIQDLVFDDNQILTVGSEPLLTRYNINGSLLSQIQCAPPSVFSACVHPTGVIAVSGYGSVVDVISQFGSHLCTFSCRGLNSQ